MYEFCWCAMHVFVYVMRDVLLFGNFSICVTLSSTLYNIQHYAIAHNSSLFEFFFRLLSEKWIKEAQIKRDIHSICPFFINSTLFIWYSLWSTLPLLFYLSTPKGEICIQNRKKLKPNKKLDRKRIPSEDLSTVNNHSLVDPLYGSILLTIFVIIDLSWILMNLQVNILECHTMPVVLKLPRTWNCTFF